ncbi:M18 family aminopeptidase [Boudabousia marimammalium]|nr:M18 family aminopeptidase [Boudabousia marimammalium]
MSINSQQFAKEFGQFIQDSPSAYHAADTVAKAFTAAGFKPQDETDTWDASAGGHYIIRDGAIIAYRIPEGAKADHPYRILGCHTDSPTLKIKPNPDATSPDGFNQVGVEIYGGALINSWLDRDLEVAGRIIDRAGKTHLVRTGPIMRVPQLAIHLDRGVNDGLKLEKQQHIHPVWGVNSTETSLLGYVARLAGLESEADIAGYDLISADTQAPSFLGGKQEMLAGGRMDNLVTVFAGMRAFLRLTEETPEAITVFAAFDHEEIGSGTRAGAAGSVLEDVLRRTTTALGGDTEAYLRALAKSSCLSSDVGHSVHPNYPQKHDPDTRPVMGKGPMLKINANQRYVTDGPGTAIWRDAVERAGVPSQEFVSHNDVPCGSTIGPMAATRLGILTVDIGVPILSMHSIRELCHVDDLVALSKVCEAYWAGK